VSHIQQAGDDVEMVATDTLQQQLRATDTTAHVLEEQSGQGKQQTLFISCINDHVL
jgi:hypothetical protein